MTEIGIYIHIPFCKHKCYYCDFISFANKSELINDYIETLKKEIIYKSHIMRDIEISTIYIGGGTPSILHSKNIEEILNTIKESFKVNINCEITIEINPGTLQKDRLKRYKEIGINRISIGLQSTNDILLEKIGRIHNYKQFESIYKSAREEGFRNINVDLMLALPNQTTKDLKESIQKVIKLQPEHISVYSLIVEDGTKIDKLLKNKEIELPVDNIERKMYWMTKRLLERSGYKHYEISNFCKVGYESKHNINCWEQKEYLGFGVAAHSYINMKRFSNIENIERYIKNINNNDFEKNIIMQENQDKEVQAKEFMMLELRKIDGISIQEFKNKFVENPIFKYHNELEELVNNGLIDIDGDIIKLTNKGLDLANIVWEKFV